VYHPLGANEPSASSARSSLASLTFLGLLWWLVRSSRCQAQASAQVIVYRISFTDLVGYNVDFFDGGYPVAPALGGAPSLVTVNRDAGGATDTAAASGGDFFIGSPQCEAVDGHLLLPRLRPFRAVRLRSCGGFDPFEKPGF